MGNRNKMDILHDIFRTLSNEKQDQFCIIYGAITLMNSDNMDEAIEVYRSKI